jgi:hypothetical protein
MKTHTLIGLLVFLGVPFLLMLSQALGLDTYLDWVTRMVINLIL